MAGEIEVKYEKLRNPQLRDFMENEFHDPLFNVTTGHDHDGVNSPTLSPSATVENNSITSAKIVDGAVIASKIGTDAVTADKILAGAVGTAELAADAVDGTKIADDAVDSEHIAAGAIDTAHIGLLQVTKATIAADAIDGTKIADNAVDSEHIKAGAIDKAHMSANSVDSDQYVDGSIDTVHIGDDQVTNDKLANISRGYVKVGGASDAPTDLNAKTSGQILIGDGTDIKSVAVSGDVTISNTGVTTIGADKVDNNKLANMTRGTIKVGGASDAPTDLNAKTSGNILIGDGTDLKSVAVSGDVTIAATGAVTIAALAVEKTMIAADAVDGTKIGDDSIDSEHIADGAIDLAHMSANSVDSDQYVDASIDTVHLAATTTPTARTIADPGTGKAIPVTGNGNVALTLAGVGETNTLAVPTFAGQILTISADTVVENATRIVTVASAINATGNNTLTFAAAGDFISLYGIKLGATFAWRVLASDGVTLSTVP